MIVLSWKSRGLDNIPRQKATRDWIHDHNPDIIFIQETKIFVDDMKNVSSNVWKRGLFHSFGSKGLVGGVSYLWNPCKIVPLLWVSN